MTNEHGAHHDAPAEPRTRRRFRWRRWLSGGVALAIFIWLLPSIIAVTPLRNVLVNRIFGDANWRASAREMSLSWYAPLTVQGLELNARSASSRITIDSLASRKEWWRLLWDRPALGSFVIDEPHADLLLGDALPRPRRQDAKVTLAAAVNGAGLRLLVPGLEEPSVDMRGFDLNLRIEPAGEGRELVVDPLVLFEYQELTEEMCNRGLHLIAPVLAGAARVDGEVSLRLDDLRVPLDVPDAQPLPRAEGSGRLQLHRVEVGLRNPLLVKLIPLIARLIDVPIPQRVRIADESDVRFRLADGRIHHTGLAFGLPTVSEDLVIRTSGSVGLDESLDVVVEVPLLGDVLGEGPIAKQLAGKRIAVRVGGTIQEPRLILPQGKVILENLVAGSEDGPMDAADIAGSAVGLAQRLIEARREREAAASRDTDAAKDAASAERTEDSPRRKRPVRRLLDRLFEAPADDSAVGDD